ncbi:hypothetical protein F8M41_004528 [Gigaspora margarita]|uniref:Uncharacterized protein n=1 Tax=Gigaspora margarita TaxID=4874 RepID=A0A8H4A7L6_GIGMA|nr:hypothetical protein F8M41_004528 [Gigaspora margarita]
MLGESSEDLQEKVNREHENNRLEEYWKGIIEERLLVSINVSHRSEDSEDQDLHTNDAQNFSANDNIVDIENKIENDLYETTSTTNIVDNETEIEIDLYETTSTTNIVCCRRRYERDNTYTEVRSRHNTDNYLATMASSISEAQDDLYDNTNLNQPDNGENSESSDDDVIIEATEAGISSSNFEVDRTSLEGLFKRAVHFEENAVQENQVEIRSWFSYGKEHENRINQMMTQNNLSLRRATMQIYSSLRSILPGIESATLYRRTRKARFAYMLFKQIGEDKIERLKSYYANSIARLTRAQIQWIVGNFPRN